MRKNILVTIIAITIISLSFMQVLANDKRNCVPCYKSYIDYNNPQFNPYFEQIYKISSASGSNIIMNDSNLKRTFFMYNGEFIFEENIIIKDNCALVSAKKLSQYLDTNIDIRKNTVRIYKDYTDLLFTSGSNKVYTDNVVETTPTNTKIVDGEFYVPLRYTAYNFGFVITYLEKGVAPFGNPVVGIDNKVINLFKEDAVKLAIKEVSGAYELYLKNDGKIHTTMQKTITLNKIKNSKCIGELSHYYVIESIKILLVDMITGDIYVKSGDGNSRHSSYIEMIKKLDYTELFS